MSPKTLTIIALVVVLVTLAAIEINAILHRRVDATISDVMREWNVMWGGLVCIGWFGLGVHFFLPEPIRKWLGW
jgi:uncharacterized membrane protein